MPIKLTKKGEEYIKKNISKEDIKKIEDALESIKSMIGDREAIFKAIFENEMEG
jgi:hypothetical protein